MSVEYGRIVSSISTRNYKWKTSASTFSGKKYIRSITTLKRVIVRVDWTHPLLSAVFFFNFDTTSVQF